MFRLIEFHVGVLIVGIDKKSTVEIFAAYAYFITGEGNNENTYKGLAKSIPQKVSTHNSSEILAQSSFRFCIMEMVFSEPRKTFDL